MEELKKCPFCGGIAEYIYEPNIELCLDLYDVDGYDIFVSCAICGARTKGFRTEEPPSETDWTNPECQYAATAWNIREQKEEAEREGE